MSLSADALYKMSEVELLAAYGEARREFVEKKFTRDTQRARLAWIKAKMFVGSTGGVTERNMAIDVSEEIARKGQELRELTRELDLLKVDADLIANVIRFRGAPAAAGGHGEDASEGDSQHEGDRAASD
jgi:ATP/maltotriose-dependent transcriptional regulator MalT